MRYINVLALFLFFFFFNDTATTEIYTLSLHDALPISPVACLAVRSRAFAAEVSTRCSRRPMQTNSATTAPASPPAARLRSEEHTSELQSPCNLVCRLLLEKKKITQCSPPPLYASITHI